MRVVLGVLLVLLLPANALAQGVDAGGDLDALQAEVNRDYAQAMASDCATACRALGSMKRATERLCALAPGDRCENAKQRLDVASARVRAACPECAEELGGKAFAPAQPTAAPAPETVQEEAAVSKKGGCAGCSEATTGGGGLQALGLAALVWLGLRRRRRPSP